MGSVVGALNSWICFPDGTFNNLDENDGDDVDNPKAGAARAAAWHFGTVATVEAVVWTQIPSAPPPGKGQVGVGVWRRVNSAREGHLWVL